MTQLNPFEDARRKIEVLQTRIAERDTLNAKDQSEIKDWLVVAKLYAPNGQSVPIPKAILPEEAPRFREGSNKAHIYQTLMESHSPWMTANEIQVQASLTKGEEIPMTSVSPTLTEMKDAGVIVRDGLKVALKIRSLTATSHQAEINLEGDV